MGGDAGHDDLVAPWDVFDLSNEQLQRQMDAIVALLAASDSPATSVVELREVIEEEMRERSMSYNLLSKIAEVRDTQKVASPTTTSEEPAEDKEEAAALPAQQQLPPPPPWYIPDPKPAATPETAAELTTAPAEDDREEPGRVPPLRRGLWDDSGSSSSDDGDAAKGPSNRWAGVFNPLTSSHFGVRRSRRKRKEKRRKSSTSVVEPVKKPPVPKFNVKPVARTAATPTPQSSAAPRVKIPAKRPTRAETPLGLQSSNPAAEKSPDAFVEAPSGRTSARREETAPRRSSISSEEDELPAPPTEPSERDELSSRGASKTPNSDRIVDEPPREEAAASPSSHSDDDVQPSTGQDDGQESRVEAAVMTKPGDYHDEAMSSSGKSNSVSEDDAPNDASRNVCNDATPSPLPQLVSEEDEVPLPNPTPRVVESETQSSPSPPRSEPNPPIRATALSGAADFGIVDYSPFGITELGDFLIEPTRLTSLAKQEAGVMRHAVADIQEGLHSWFKSMSEIAKEEEDDDTYDSSGAPIDYGNDYMWYRVQQSRSEVYDLVAGVMDDRRYPRWEETAEVGRFWNLWWSWKKPRPKERVWLATQWVNHIPKSSQLTRKDLLKANIQRYTKGGRQSRFDILPLSFNLPSEYVSFAKSFADRGGLWIMKTVGMSRGRGIKLVSKIDEVTYSDPVVIQRYIERPLLLEGHKFDLRLYVVVTQFSPLECFLSRRGFARLASSKYSLDASTLDDKSKHLTNTSVTRQTAKEASAAPARTDTKWSLDRLRNHLAHTHDADWDTLWETISDVILRALTCAEDNIQRTPCTFELFGFDVLLDDNLRPWVLEVNASPAMDVEGPVDEDVKPGLIDDIISLIDPLPIDKIALNDMCDAFKGVSHKATPGEKTKLLHRHMTKVLRGRVPRKYGEEPADMGSFERLAPGKLYDKVVKQKRSA